MRAPPEWSEWSDRVIVITGASSGIGRATAVACARKGAKLILCSRDRESLDNAADDCRSHGVNVQAQPADVADLQAIDRVRDKALGVHGRIDVWINSAAVLSFGRFRMYPSKFSAALSIQIFLAA